MAYQADSNNKNDHARVADEEAFDWQFWAPPYPAYPPSLKVIPPSLDLPVDQIFDPFALFATQQLVQGQTGLFDGLAPITVTTMQGLVDFNRVHHEKAEPNMYRAQNIGLRPDWYTDAVFGQQQFTGTNPTTIALTSSDWVNKFRGAAALQKLEDVVELLTEEPQNFFVQDYSYFHPYMKVPWEVVLPPRNDDPDQRVPGYGGASVALFRFEPAGKLHPVAITLDYLGSMENSVTIFNRRITSDAPGDESTDWPWRYAKMLPQVADWLVHEVVVHLLLTHLVEEVVLVAAHRAFEPEPNHVVFELLKAHQDVTFPLNKAAREVLVPGIIIPLAAFPAATVATFLASSYENFDWKGSYIPNDLKKRGFPIQDLDQTRYRNYAWARGIVDMWNIIRKFVGTALTQAYTGGDAQVASDPLIAAYCDEVRSLQGGQLRSFPERIATLDDLIDVVTMCIHIASPQHTSINYLQQYYMTFIPNRPSALYTPLPRSLEALQSYTEQDVLDALPVKYELEWLLMGQIPYLLSFPPPTEKTLLTYAKTTAESGTANPIIRDAAKTLVVDLLNFTDTVVKYSNEMDDHTTPYLVLDPLATASSIII